MFLYLSDLRSRNFPEKLKKERFLTFWRKKLVCNSKLNALYFIDIKYTEECSNIYERHLYSEYILRSNVTKLVCYGNEIIFICKLQHVVL